MTDHARAHICFICPHCDAVNELTVAEVHESTVIHCSRCSVAAGPLGHLRHRHQADDHADLRQAG